jgi:hypothetical protein
MAHSAFVERTTYLSIRGASIPCRKTDPRSSDAYLLRQFWSLSFFFDPFYLLKDWIVIRPSSSLFYISAPTRYTRITYLFRLLRKNLGQEVSCTPGQTPCSLESLRPTCRLALVQEFSSPCFATPLVLSRISHGALSPI